MAYTTINKPTDYFNTVLYTGNTTAPRTITGVGFQPDWNWTKNRSATLDHWIADSVKGINSIIRSNQNSTNLTNPSSGYISAVNGDGYVISEGSSTDDNYNTNSQNYVSWNWKAGTTGSGTTTGSGYGKAYSYSVSTTAGFSIVKYIGNGTAGHTIPHHLGATPGLIMLKNLDHTEDWLVYHHKNTDAPETDYLVLNSTNATGDSAGVWNDTAPTSSVFTVGTAASTNGSDDNLIAYCFAEKTGYSKFGQYTANAAVDGNFIYTGFKPAFVLIKSSNSAQAGQDWFIYDSVRDPGNAATQTLQPNTTSAEETNVAPIDILSNGFKLRTNTGRINGTNGEYIYMAFAEAPLVGSNNVPCTAS